MKKFCLFLAMFLLLIPLLSAGFVQAEEPAYGGTFRYGTTTNPRGMFNPILSTEVYDGYIIDLVYDGLIYVDENLEVQPQIAESWEYSEDGLSITFYLREGVKFHDGHELTARDVAFTFTTICDPYYTGVRYGNFSVLKGAEDYHQGEIDYVEGIKILDDYTIKFTTEEPFAPFLYQFTYGILPYHRLKDVPVAELEAHRFNSNPVGAGPFKFVEFRTDQHVILDVFEDYHDGRPYLNRVVFQVLSEDAVVIYLRQGRVDFVGVTSEQFPMVKALDFVDTYVYEALSYSYLAFNLRQERFNDVKVRQAMKYGFDRDTYVNIILDGFGIKANAPMPKASWAFTDEGINDYPYDPELAAQMLAEAGWEKGSDGILTKADMRLDFEVIYGEGTRATEQMMLLFQQNMGDLGINVELRPMDFSAAVDRVDARDFDMFTMGWSLSADPDPHGIWFSEVPWNDPGFYNERSDELILEGRQTMEQEKRQEIYAEWQQIINYELPYIFLNYSVAISAVNQRIKGIDTDPGPGGPLLNRYLLREVWIPEHRQ